MDKWIRRLRRLRLLMPRGQRDWTLALLAAFAALLFNYCLPKVLT